LSPAGDFAVARLRPRYLWRLLCSLFRIPFYA